MDPVFKAEVAAGSLPCAPEASSFRDPSGYMFWRGGEIYRCVRSSYVAQFRAAEKAGLFERCIRDGMLLPYTSGHEPPDGERDAAIVLKPQQLSLISYPYEWSFDQLRDAALLTLDLHVRALEHDMVLKDASAYNVQMVNGSPCFIDHLSFDSLASYGMWPAYGQFCRHFLAPLMLMAHVDLSLGKLLQIHIDGIPLPLASQLLPASTRFNLRTYLHVHLHSKLVSKHGGSRKKIEKRALSASQLTGIALSLRGLIAKLKPKHVDTEWGAYYSDTNYSDAAFDAKKSLVRELVEIAKPRLMWDVGGNDGTFSRLVADLVPEIVCMDVDPVAVGRNYSLCKSQGVSNITPLVIDLCNPSSAIGFANSERQSLGERRAPDLVQALALIHHLAISNNVPFWKIADYFASLGEYLLIEFVGRKDSQVERLLLNRTDIFSDYSEDKFRAAFERRYALVGARSIPSAERTLYLFRRKEA